MNFDLTDEQEMLKEGARRFATEHYSFEERRRIAASVDGFSRSLWKSYAEMGWLALGLPEDVGGLGCSFVETALLMLEFGRVMALEPFASSAILCARIIDRSGNSLQRTAVLPEFIEGNLLMALAHAEPGLESRDPLVRDTTATSIDGHYLLNGNKTLIYDAPSADHFVVSAKLGAGFGLFLVGKDAVGLRVSAYPLIDGSRAGDLNLRDVRVPAAALLVGPDRAPDVLEEALDRVILGRIAEALGAMEGVLDITNGYLKQRVQFGQTIGKFQALQHRMAEMFVEVQETRSMLYRGLALLDSSAAERASAISAAKVVAAKAAKFVGTEGIQLHGGIGMTEEYAVGHYYKKLLVFEKRYGDSDFHIDRFIRSSKTDGVAAVDSDRLSVDVTAGSRGE